MEKEKKNEDPTSQGAEPSQHLKMRGGEWRLFTSFPQNPSLVSEKPNVPPVSLFCFPFGT
jgi:hypothetical protein